MTGWLDADHRRHADQAERTDRELTLMIVVASAALMIALVAFIAIVSVLAFASGTARASGEFACRGVPFVSDGAKTAFAEHAPHQAARQVLIEHALRWDAAEMRHLCDAKAAGDDVALVCLDGRRDWNAIVRSVPKGQLVLSSAELNAVLTKLRTERARTRPHQRAVNHCVRIGAVDGIVQPVPGVEGE